MGSMSRMYNSRNFHKYLKNGDESRALEEYLENADKIDVNFFDHFLEESALMLAIKHRFEDIKTILLQDRRIWLSFTNSDGESALSYAAAHGDHRTLYFLINSGVNFNSVNNEGNSIIHLAVMSANVNVLQVIRFLDIDIDWNLRNMDGKTPFFISIGNFDTESLRFLAGIPEVDVNIPDFNGRTPGDYLNEVEYDSERFDILLKLGDRFKWTRKFY